MQEGVKKTKVDNNYYVYLHRKKSDGTVFYVGKGKGKRAWNFTKRSQLWNNYKNKYDMTVEIVQANILEWYAFELEQELILLYGRLDNNTGVLVNFTDGGDGTSGWIPSKQYRANLSARVKGTNHHLYQDTVIDLVNIYTNEVFSGTRYEFKHKTGCELHHNSRNVKIHHVKGWIVKGSLTNYEIEAIKSKFSGKYCYNVILDKSDYEFINTKTLESITCKRYEFEERYKILVGTLFGINSNLSVKGWSLKSVVDKFGLDFINKVGKGIQNGRADKNIYSFTNLVTKDIFVGNRIEFQTKYSVNIADLFKGSLSCKDWKLTDTNNSGIGRDYTIYNLIHASGETFNGLHRDFRLKYKHTIKPLIRKAPASVCKGWTLVK